MVIWQHMQWIKIYTLHYHWPQKMSTTDISCLYVQMQQISNNNKHRWKANWTKLKAQVKLGMVHQKPMANFYICWPEIPVKVTHSTDWQLWWYMNSHSQQTDVNCSLKGQYTCRLALSLPLAKFRGKLTDKMS